MYPKLVSSDAAEETRHSHMGLTPYTMRALKFGWPFRLLMLGIVIAAIITLNMIIMSTTGVVELER